MPRIEGDQTGAENSRSTPDVPTNKEEAILKIRQLWGKIDALDVEGKSDTVERSTLRHQIYTLQRQFGIFHFDIFEDEGNPSESRNAHLL